MNVNLPPPNPKQPSPSNEDGKLDKEKLYEERMTEPFGDKIYPPGTEPKEESIQELIDLFKKKIPPSKG